MELIYVSTQKNWQPPQPKRQPYRLLSSPEEAFRIAQEGDCVYLDSGSHFTGNITVSSKKGLKIASIGPGHALFDVGGTAGLIFRNCTDILICGIILKGNGFHSNHFGGLLLDACQNIQLLNLEISGFGLYGIQYQNTENLWIDGCCLYRNGSAGICAGTGKSRHVRISHCKTLDNAGNHMVQDNHSGSGIIISYTNDAIVEFCESAGNGWAQRQTKANGPVGIWCWGNAENVVFRYNIAHHNRTQPGGVDGDGFDIDGGAKHVVMEHCYSYLNEAAGFLLCEYGSDMGWHDNHIKNCVSMLDVTRIFGYGAVHLYCPPGTKMRGSEICGNLFILSANVYAVENREICENYTEITVDNNCIAGGKGVFSCMPQKEITSAGNIRYDSQDIPLPNTAIALTEPRHLPYWPPLRWLSGKRRDEAEWQHRLASLSHTPPMSPSHETFWFSLRLNGSDLEGSFQLGQCELVYDSLKSGYAARLSETGSEISSYLPNSLMRGRCILKAYGRAMAADTAVCLFVREKSGAEQRSYWNGSVSAYSMMQLSFTPKEEGTLFGIHYEKGHSPFLIERIDVYTTDQERPDTSLDFAAHCSFFGNAYRDMQGEIVLENGGSMCFAYLQSDATCMLHFESKGPNGFAFAQNEMFTVQVPISADDWTQFTLKIPAGTCIQIGFAMDQAVKSQLNIRHIYME